MEGSAKILRTINLIARFWPQVFGSAAFLYYLTTFSFFREMVQ
jgi:hypothetical protein